MDIFLCKYQGNSDLHREILSLMASSGRARVKDSQRKEREKERKRERERERTHQQQKAPRHHKLLQESTPPIKGVHLTPKHGKLLTVITP